MRPVAFATGRGSRLQGTGCANNRAKERPRETYHDRSGAFRVQAAKVYSCATHREEFYPNRLAVGDLLPDLGNGRKREASPGGWLCLS